jgi:hypothetical protein
MKSRLEEIKANHEFRKGEGWELTTLTEDIDWLIEQAEKYQRIRDKFLEQTIQKNHEALRKLADS